MISHAECGFSRARRRGLAGATSGASALRERAETLGVVSETGARVFLDAAAAAVLDDKVLDAAPDENGAVRFELLPQP